MNSGQGQLPRYVVIEKGAAKAARNLLLNHLGNDKQVVLVTNQDLNNKYSALISSLPASKVIYVESAQIREVREKILELSELVVPPLLIAFGGGTIIDATKFIAQATGAIYVSMPSSLSHDGICSPVCVIEDGQMRRRLGAPMPVGVVIDTEVIRGAPAAMTAAGVGDLFSNISAVADWELAHRETGEVFDGFAAILATQAVESVMGYGFKDVASEGFLKRLGASLVVSGIAMMLAGNSRPCSGSEHLFSHAIDYLFPKRRTLHGTQVAFGTLIAELLRGNDISRLVTIFRSIGLPVTTKEFGFTLTEVIAVTKEAPRMRPERYTILNAVPLAEDYLARQLAQLDTP